MATNFAVISEKIQNLYKFRDEFFLIKQQNEWPSKNSMIEDEIKIISNELENVYSTLTAPTTITANSNNDKAKYYFLKGWLLNIRDQYDHQVFESLTKSIKFNPDNEKAWLELGECYFKKGNYDLALDCFEKIIKINPNEKHALRNLSIMLRTCSNQNMNISANEKYKNLMKSIDLAKKAIECDADDCNSWAILGNAYLTVLFMTPIGSRSDLLFKCKSAYQKAISDRVVRTKSDVLYNYSTVLQYDEDFQQTIQLLHDAYRYDPEWKELLHKKQRLLSIFADICQQGNKLDRNVIKAKKLTNIKNELQSNENQLNSKYHNEQKFFNGKTKLIEELSLGTNECLLVCRIISYIADVHNIFFSSIYSVIDSHGHTIVLFIYDLIKNKGPRPGDTLILIKPYLKEYQIKFDDHNYQFKAIKIMNPLQEILVNNSQITKDCISMPTISVTLKSD